ncbi:MAG: aminopeptidase P family N-terminal domain-containing protein, partial [Oscillospiraceae bacterium]|nr:aminopeptidase P family N-terminal domain-containing protein [Oscillospiraceae bacterium]
MIKQRVADLQNLLKEKNLSALIIPTNDFHMSEYVGEYFKARKHFSGFTGSAGVMVVTQDEANLWTDGRYFIQAERELENTGVILRKMGEPGVPTVKEYVVANVPQGGKLAFDGRVIPVAEGRAYAEELGKKGATLHTTEDLPGMVWENRPALSAEKAYVLTMEYAGKSTADKLSDIREKMTEAGADIHVIAALEDIAWLYNIRGNDISRTPVVLSFAVVTMDKAYIFANPEIFDESVMAHFEQSGVEVKPYEEIYSYVSAIGEDKTVLLDPSKTNFAVVNAIKAKIVEKQNPSLLMKAVKNPTELENSRNAHIKDCVAVTKFMYWLKTNAGKIPMTEVSAQEYVSYLRSIQPGYLDLSFDPICGYKENAAMMHYSAQPETTKEVTNEGMLLLDSGGHYNDGSTDITRTFVLGEISDEIKAHFTAVVRGVLALQNVKFLKGCIGQNLDILAREPLWEVGLDYKCGTGHGVGHILGVHEGPNGFRWQNVPGKNEGGVFVEGMITTIEPGVYIEGSHGIRIENEVICREGVKNEYGQFMYFEPVTFAPIDLDGINPELMDKKEIK